MSLSTYSSELASTAKSLAKSGKGILAVDESTRTIGKRLGSVKVENTEASRQAYRGMLFTTEGLGQFISGAILYEETLFQNHVDGESMVNKLNKLTRVRVGQVLASIINNSHRCETTILNRCHLTCL